jgi:hypothetical protein
MLLSTDQSGMTLQELMLRVARETGVARIVQNGEQCESQLPTGPTLAKVRDAVDAAWRDFLAADADWSFLQQTITLNLTADGKGPDNIAGDPMRYRLPNTIRTAVSAPWTLRLPDSTVVWVVKTTSMASLAQIQWGNSARAPYAAAMRPLPNPEDHLGGPAWELVVAPKPDQPYLLIGQFALEWAWTELGERHIFGAAHDQTLVHMAVAAFRRRDGLGASEMQMYQQIADRALANSLRLDSAKRDSNLGRVRSFPDENQDSNNLPGPTVLPSNGVFVGA